MKNRVVLWDMDIADEVRSIRLKMHSPTRKNPALVCDAPWEGEHSGYGQIIHDGEKYRLYYRGAGANDGPWQLENGSHSLWCVAFSNDGKHFEKPNLGIYEYNGNKDNNIIFMNGETDNFAIMLDTNPNCPPSEKYKAVSGHQISDEKYIYSLKTYASADGIHFEETGMILEGKGTFDSMNIPLWDEKLNKYCIYMRDYHPTNPDYKIEYENESHVRDIRVTYSDDFVNWSDPVLIDYGDKTEFQLYTNGIMKYYRSDVYLGTPTRYIDRSLDKINYKHLPDLHGYRELMGQKQRRSSIAITDTLLMTSKDGVNFNRTREAFFTPGIENGENWVYGDCYFAHDIVQTASDFYGEPDEMSLYVGKGYRSRPVSFERYTLRLDGFFSWRADYEEGEAITKPITIESDHISVNFSTSALGYLKIELLNENCNVIEGYNSGRLFGDSVSRPIEFENPLGALTGQKVRLKITMKDADFYSFNFE